MLRIIVLNSLSVIFLACIIELFIILWLLLKLLIIYGFLHINLITESLQHSHVLFINKLFILDSFFEYLANDSLFFRKLISLILSSLFKSSIFLSLINILLKPKIDLNSFSCKYEPFVKEHMYLLQLSLLTNLI